MRWLSLAFLLSTACAGGSFALRPPAHFLTLDPAEQARAGWALRAVSAEGVVLAVRTIDDPGAGSQEFWTQAISNELRRGGAYVLLDEEEVRAASGEVGHRLRFGRDDEGHPYHYWVTVFTTERTVFVVEAGGREDRFAAVQAELEAALSGFRIR